MSPSLVDTAANRSAAGPVTDAALAASPGPTSDRAKVPQERVPAAVRREQILAAASRVFGERGYVGATTDQVAQAAGISQPYVVRMFGGKENLFVEVLDRAVGTLMQTFRVQLDESRRVGEDQDALMSRLASAYADLIVDRGILMSLMQGFVAGHEPAIGAKARSGFMEIYALLRNDAGLTAESIVDFLAHGMLFNTLIAMRMLDCQPTDDPGVTELLAQTFGAKLDVVMATVLGGSEGTGGAGSPGGTGGSGSTNVSGGAAASGLQGATTARATA